MHREVILAAFEKALRDIGKSQKYPRAEHLALVIQELKIGETISAKTLVNYYDIAMGDGDAEIVIRQKIKDALFRYLEVESYEELKEKYPGLWPSKESSFWLPKFGRTLWISLGTVLCVGGIILLIVRNISDRVMIWKGDHYEEVQLDLKTYSLSDLKIYNEDRIRDFKKVTPDCDFTFYNEDGLAALWYGKNAKGDLEYFTALGRHPETGKTLKAITPYMIKKYICESYK